MDSDITIKDAQEQTKEMIESLNRIASKRETKGTQTNEKDSRDIELLNGQSRQNDGNVGGYERLEEFRKKREGRKRVPTQDEITKISSCFSCDYVPWIRRIGILLLSMGVGFGVWSLISWMLSSKTNFPAQTNQQTANQSQLDLE